MSSPKEDRPAETTLDAEREALRNAGYSEVEVSQILVARAVSGSPQPTSGTSSGVFSAVISSLVAVASQARHLLFSFRDDVTTIFDTTAKVSSRAGATALLAVKAVVLALLGYAAWQEWNQHIINAPEIARQQARELKVRTDALAQPPIRFDSK